MQLACRKVSRKGVRKCLLHNLMVPARIICSSMPPGRVRRGRACRYSEYPFVAGQI